MINPTPTQPSWGMLVVYRREVGSSSTDALQSPNAMAVTPQSSRDWRGRVKRSLLRLLSRVGGGGPLRMEQTVRSEATIRKLLNRLSSLPRVPKQEDSLALVASLLTQLMVADEPWEMTNHSPDLSTPSMPKAGSLLRGTHKGDRQLDLSGLHLLTIQATGRLRSVRHLDLSDNQLSCLPAQLPSQLPRLQHLDLRQNQLSTLPSDLSAWSQSLHTLLLDRNCFAQWPSGLAHLRSLRHLSLARNPALRQPLQVRLLTPLSQLEQLDLSHNPHLPALPHRLLQEHPDLRSLFTDGCVRMAEQFQQASLQLLPAIQTPPSPPPPLARLTWLCWQQHQQQANYAKDLPAHLRQLGSLCGRCDWCGGPVMPDTMVRRYRQVLRMDRLVVVEYALCRPHWNTESQYMELLINR